MPDTTVSIVITNYNYARFVGAAIESALAQGPNVEVIVVDDGSTDDSIEVVEAYDNVSLVAKANGGQASAFNAGAATATGAIVLFLDADDVLFDGAIAQISGAFAADPQLSRVHYRLRLIDATGTRLDGRLPEAGRALPVGDLRAELESRPSDIAWQPTSGNAFSAAVLHQILPMPEAPYRISADYYLSNISAVYGPVGAIERDLAGYRVHGANAHHRDRFDASRAREVLLRSEETCRHLIEHGTRAGWTMPSTPEGFTSSTLAGMRLLSLRADANAHPFDGDSRWSLMRTTWRALADRTDLAPARKLLGFGWTLAAGVVPRRLLGAIADTGLTR